MRQLSAVTNLVLAGLASVALALSLQLPWLAPPGELPEGLSAPERAVRQIAHVFQTVPGEVSGQDAFVNSRSTLFAMAVATVGLCALMGVPGLRGMLREVLRALGLITPLAVGYLLLARPGGVAGDLHWGAFAALGVSVFVASAAWHGSAIRERRPVAGSWAAR
jgi:hypothetical protein